MSPPRGVHEATHEAAVPLDMRLRADPLADATIAAILGPWNANPETCSCEQMLASNVTHWQRIGLVNSQLERWKSNADLIDWRADPNIPEYVAAPLEAFVKAGQGLPSWANPAQIARAETLFIDYGLLSCTLLFCASLPECYVIPDLASVLQTAGQLEQHTEHRIRVTAAMIFPVMMRGGMTSPQESGIAQVLKVRLIHATIRNLILRGDPALASLTNAVPPLSAAAPTSMHQAMFVRGWNIAEEGMPCDQEELSYTLLTFGYVFLRGLRRLGLGLSASDEEAFLHAWNVVGHVLGIERALMADTMAQAEALFVQMQVRGRARPVLPDPRPALGRALMQAMENVIPFRVVRPFPALMTRYLCGSVTARELGIDQRAGWISRLLFVSVMLVTRAIDTLARLVFPEFSIARLITRIVGYQFTTKLMLDQTRPLKLPERLLNQVDGLTQTWQCDPKAPAWMNKLEQRLTGRADKAA